MEDIQKRIKAIEKEMRETPYHKGTEHYIGLLRARLAKLKDQTLEKEVGKGGGGKRFSVKKHGDATVVLIGYPSVGKSTLLNKLTNAQSKIAEYAFTTVTVIPGMMVYKGAKIQILDVPGLIEGASQGKGRGREVLSVVRNADLLLIIATASQRDEYKILNDELYSNGVRVNQEKPNIEINKTGYSGLQINSSVKQELDKETILDICKEFHLVNASVHIKEKVTIDKLIDVFAANRIYAPAIFVESKADLDDNKKEDEIVSGEKIVKVSAKAGIGIDELKEAVWTKLGFARVYLKNWNGKTDFDKPLIMKKDDCLNDVMQKVGSEFAEYKKSAKIWGNGARFSAQEVSLNIKVQDGMEVQFI